MRTTYFILHSKFSLPLVGKVEAERSCMGAEELKKPSRNSS